MTKITHALFLSALKDSFGNQSAIATRLKVDRSAITKYLNIHPELRIKIQEAEEKGLDFVETKALSRIKEGSDRLISFWLERKGKNRGFAQRTEIENTGDSAKLEEAKKVNIEIMRILKNHPEAKNEVLKYLTEENKGEKK